MDIWLIASEIAMALLFQTALGAALLGKTGRGWLYWLLLTPWLLLMVGGWVLITATLYRMTESNVSPSYIPHACVVTLALALGGLWVIIAGNLRREGRLAAAKWPALRLFLVWVAASLLQVLTISRVDSGVCQEMAVARQRANQQYLDLLKPVDNPSANAASLYATAFADLLAKVEVADAADAEASEDKAAPPDIAVIPPPFNLGFPGGNLASRPSAMASAGKVDDPRVVSLISEVSSSIEMVRQATTRPVCRMSEDPEPPGLMASCPELRGFRTTSELIRCHALIEARAGRFDSAIQDVLALRRMRCHVQQTRVGVLHLLVGMGIDTLADQTLTDVLPLARSPVSLPPDARTSEATLRQNLLATVNGEEASAIRNLLDFCEGRLGPIGTRGERASVGRAYRIAYLRPDLPALAQYFAAIRTSVQGGTCAGLPASSSGPLPAGGPLIRILRPSLTTTVSRTYRHKLAMTYAADVAVALTNYRITEGDYPPALGDLVPRYLAAVPVDPFDGKSMRYLVKDGEVTVYSVGEDRLDDGGQLERKEDDPYRKTLDVGLVLKKPVIPASPS